MSFIIGRYVGRSNYPWTPDRSNDSVQRSSAAGKWFSSLEHCWTGTKIRNHNLFHLHFIINISRGGCHVILYCHFCCENAKMDNSGKSVFRGPGGAQIHDLNLITHFQYITASMIPFALNISNLVLLYNSFNYFEAVSKHFWPVRAITLCKYTKNPNPSEVFKSFKFENPKISQDQGQEMPLNLVHGQRPSTIN